MKYNDIVMAYVNTAALKSDAYAKFKPSFHTKRKGHVSPYRYHK